MGLFGSFDLLSSLMRIAGQFVNCKDYVKPCENVVKEFCTPDNIAMAATAITSGIQTLENETGKNYAVVIEPTADRSDTVLTVYNRINGKLTPDKTIFLKHITQSDLLMLANLIGQSLNNGRNK